MLPSPPTSGPFTYVHRGVSKSCTCFEQLGTPFVPFPLYDAFLAAKRRQASDSVLSVLQDAANIGLARYPERLGQLFVVNVPATQTVAVLIAARAVGLGPAIDTGRLKVLPGELPKWAPELRKVRETWFQDWLAAAAAAAAVFGVCGWLALRTACCCV